MTRSKFLSDSSLQVWLLIEILSLRSMLCRLTALLGTLAMMVPFSSRLNSVIGSILAMSSLVAGMLVGSPLIKIVSGLLVDGAVSSRSGVSPLAASQFS